MIIAVSNMKDDNNHFFEEAGHLMRPSAKSHCRLEGNMGDNRGRRKYRQLDHGRGSELSSVTELPSLKLKIWLTYQKFRLPSLYLNYKYPSSSILLFLHHFIFSLISSNQHQHLHVRVPPHRWNPFMSCPFGSCLWALELCVRLMKPESLLAELY